MGEDFKFPSYSVLGIQAEACFKAYLQQSPYFEVLASNLQIQGETETLGELDYIVKNLITKENIHIELACKFYLYDENRSKIEEQKWIGPNQKDTLFEKLEKLKSKQFPLLYASETTKTLNEMEIEIPSKQQLCLKAFLFIPKDSNQKSFPKNYRNCIVGHYLKWEEFSEEKQAKYYLPSKKEWLLPENSIHNWQSFSEIGKQVEEQIRIKKSPLVYEKTQNNVERFFVVWW
ncbi:DUF1853 family protein [Aequorivita echinoideorum]|uniref:DUF1853 family protein n=1 Tax=Aequorivita echinoideorum TaxID=1549647 RepID=UPI003898EE74